MPILKTKACVLRLTPYGNSSQVIVLLGSAGDQIRLLAKGIRRCPRKGFEGGMDLLSRGELVYYPRASGGLSIFKEWDELQSQWEVAGRPGGLEALSYVAELAEGLSAEDESCPGLFEAVGEAVQGLRDGAATGGVLLRFTWRALRAFGEGPEIERCVLCGRRQPEEVQASSPSVPLKSPGAGRTMPAWRKAVRFSPRDGGIVCGACARGGGREGAFELGRGALQALQGLVAEGPIGGLAVWHPLRPHAQQLARLLTSYLRHALGRELRTLAFARGAVVSDALDVTPS
jgi:DNA repair protein RecO